MKTLQFVFFLAACLVLAVASPVDRVEPYEPALDDYEVILSRHARSPQHGSVSGTYKQDQNGREASVQYNHNLYTSKDGQGSIDAYGQASRNFDHNQNNYGGGIQGSWRF